MAQCDFDGRPAVAQVTVSENGEGRVINLCEEHYEEFMARRGRSRGLGRSPLESLFGGGSLFDRLMDDAWSPFGDMDGARGGGRAGGTADTGGGRRGARQGGRGQRSREAVDLQSFLSEAAMERLQAAAEKALEYGKNEVDTEHLLLALIDNDVVQEILREFKLSRRRAEERHRGKRAARRAASARRGRAHDRRWASRRARRARWTTR